MTYGAALDWLHWDWDWANFWTNLIAGLGTLALAVASAWYIFVRELQTNRSARFEEFRNLASEVRADLVDIRIFLQRWDKAVAEGNVIDRIDNIPLVWELALPQLAVVFAAHRVQRETQTAILWYKRALTAARRWNEGLESNMTDETISDATYYLAGAKAQIDYAISRLTEVARLGPVQSSVYPSMRPQS